jgi:hypothetical protein
MDYNKKKSIEKKTLFKCKNQNAIIKKNYKKKRKIVVQNLEGKVKSINTFDLLKYVKSKNKKAKIYF